MHLLSEGEFCFDGNKVFFEGLFKISPCAEIWWGLFHGNLLAIACPFSCWGSEFEMREGGGNFEALVSIQGVIQIVVGFKGGPEGVGHVGGAIKQFWRGAQGFGGI